MVADHQYLAREEVVVWEGVVISIHSPSGCQQPATYFAPPTITDLLQKTITDLLV